MERRLAGLFLVALSVGTGACLVVDTDDIGGSNFGGTSSDGGSTPIGGSTGNQGGSPACVTADDCPVPEFECSEATCDADVCSEVFSVAGFICSAGICDGEGFCVECIDDTDCTEGGGTCDVKSGTCIDENLTGDCADTFCAALPADGTCANCLIAAGQAGGSCTAEFSACNGEGMGASDCATCLEHVQGSAQPFCTGSQATFDVYFDCICTGGSGACVD